MGEQTREKAKREIQLT